MVDAVIIFMISYLIGSFPTAIIAGKILKGIDVREHGSGNAGATNVLRVLGWKAGVSVLLIDMFKGFAPVFWIAALVHGVDNSIIYYQIIAAVAAIVGHIWTIFAGFKGGKGVGTSAGVFMGLAPLPLIIALLIFILIVAITKYVSLGSMLSALVFLITLLLQRYVFAIHIPAILIYLAVIAVVLIWYAHRENIKRLLKGEENKINFHKKTEQE